MKSTTHILLLLLAGIMFASPLAAQETTTTPSPEPVQETIEKTDYEETYVVRKIIFGAFAGYSLDIHSADALTLPNVPSCCPGYEGGTGGGFIGGISMAFPIGDDLDLMGRLSYHTSSVTMTANEEITIREGNQAVPATIMHELQPSLGMLSFEPGVVFRLGDAFSLVGGVRLGTYMSGTYEQKSVLDPSIAYDFEGGSGVRNQSEGDIQDLSSFQFGMFLGARYALGLDRSGEFHLIPEIQFAPMFTSIIADQTWSMSSFRFMLNFTQTISSVEKRSSPLEP